MSKSIDRVVVFRAGNSNNRNGLPNLYDCKTLSQLWAEYQYGLAGNKPARTFSVAERNVKEIKFRYHWRKKFWREVVQLVRHTTAELAICSLIVHICSPWQRSFRSHIVRGYVLLIYLQFLIIVLVLRDAVDPQHADAAF